MCAAAIIGSRVARSGYDDCGSLQGRQGYLYKAQKPAHRRTYMHYDDNSKRPTQKEGKCVSPGSRTPAVATDCSASRRGAWRRRTRSLSWESGVGAQGLRRTKTRRGSPGWVRVTLGQTDADGGLRGWPYAGARVRQLSLTRFSGRLGGGVVESTEDGWRRGIARAVGHTPEHACVN
jgi:hypothetical protein